MTETALRATLEDIWERPKPKLDTATVLELHPTPFSFLVISAIFCILSVFIGYVAEQAGQSEAARAIGPPAFAAAVVAAVAFVVLLFLVLTIRSHYKDEKAFAANVIDRVLALPSAPNFHIFERVGLPRTFGSTTAETAADALHEWMTEIQATLTEALAREVGLSADEPMIKGTKLTIGEIAAGSLDGKLGELHLDQSYEVSLTAASARIWKARQNISYRCRNPSATVGALTPQGEKLLDAVVHATATVHVTQTPAHAWYLVHAELSEPQSGPAEDALSFA